MKGNYSKLLTNLAGMAGVVGMSLFVTLPSQAKEVLNPNPSIFREAYYNRSQRVLANASYTSVEDRAPLAIATNKNNVSNKNLVAQKPRNRGLNPSPSIFNEPPYNRGSQATPSETVPTPVTPPAETPSKPTTEVPTTGTSNQKQNVVTLAESNSSFKILTQALKAAGLTETLKGAGPFTIFAPTDAAFAKLPQDALKDLLKPENKEVLVKILTYHVVSGKVLSSDLKSGQVTSLQGDPIMVKVGGSGVVINDGKVIQADIQGSNGVIHAIDNVILPPSL
ncbi:fasciclin domain-containing protein [Fortiea sp. LEGE XX443]|uniref:fasciclin domain-containing protein n=1 Tax=Fortiea sp. LEGE XX443 TaxID=1828611 RepID=UPI00187E3ED9|nr:fasciclin domain-containing protein [Fortiea sp. LEGE XX443]MBE9004769.1 fasciclin domain-containing protein [Fortiea sp. LEGE XX443]